MLVSAHPLFGSSAYVMGNVNEPPRGAPSLELVETQLVALANDDPLMVRAGLTQDKKSLAAFEAFAKEQTEVKMKGTGRASDTECGGSTPPLTPLLPLQAPSS